MNTFYAEAIFKKPKIELPGKCLLKINNQGNRWQHLVSDSELLR